MDRKEINSFIRAKGGKQLDTCTTDAAYAVKMSEVEFIEFRSKIPFLTSWYTETPKGVQIFRVWYNHLAYVANKSV